MRGGIWVLNIFGAIWAVSGILVGHLLPWLSIFPVMVSAALLLWESRQPLGRGSPVEGNHVGRVVGIAIAIEGIAMFLAANVLINMHMPSVLMPAFAIIVGLHFIPLARWIPVPLYCRTGAALIATGLAALLLAPADRAVATGIVAALILWASGIMLARHGRG